MRPLIEGSAYSDLSVNSAKLSRGNMVLKRKRIVHSIIGARLGLEISDL